MASVWIWATLVLIIVAAFAMALLGHMTVEVEYHHHHGDDEGHVECRALWNLVRIRRRLIGIEVAPTDQGPAMQVKHAPQSTSGTAPEPAPEETKFSVKDLNALWGKVRSWWPFLRAARPTLKRFTSRMNLSRLQIHAVVGTGDAVTTGILCGSVWSLLYGASGWVYAQVGTAASPDIKVTPAFQAFTWSLDVRCIVRVRVGHAIVAAFELIRLWRRRTPHGTPHSRVNEYRHVEYP